MDPAAGAAKAAEVMEAGSRLGVFWNHTVHAPDIRAIFRFVYGRHAPGLLDGGGVVLGTMRPDTAVDPDAQALRNAGSFRAVERRTYRWARTYSIESWLDELPTHSDHRFLASGVRAAPLRRPRPGTGQTWRAVRGRLPDPSPHGGAGRVPGVAAATTGRRCVPQTR